jgi:hypothetical protein
MKSIWWKASLFLLAASGYCVAQSDAPSLGDVARQNRGAKKATVVLSDQDQAFSRTVESSQSSSSFQSTAASSDSPANSAPAPKTDAGKSAAATSKDSAASASAKEKLEFYKSEQQAWKTIAKRDEDLLANETAPFRRQMYQDALDGDRKTIGGVEEKINELQSEMDKKGKTASTSGGK